MRNERPNIDQKNPQSARILFNPQDPSIPLDSKYAIYPQQTCRQSPSTENMGSLGNLENGFPVPRNRGTCMFHDTHAASCRLCTAYPFIGLRLCDSVSVRPPNLGMSRVPGGKSITRYDEQHAKHSPVKTPTEYDGNHSDRNFMVTHTASQCQCWHTGNRCSTGVPTRTPDTFVGRNE